MDGDEFKDDLIETGTVMTEDIANCSEVPADLLTPKILSGIDPIEAGNGLSLVTLLGIEGNFTKDDLIETGTIIAGGIINYLGVPSEVTTAAIQFGTCYLRARYTYSLINTLVTKGNYVEDDLIETDSAMKEYTIDSFK